MLCFFRYFSAPVISQIKSVGGGQAGGVGVGVGVRWGAKGGLKHPFRLKKQCCAFSF